MYDPNGKEWMFLVKNYKTCDIMDSYDEILDAAKRAYDENEKADELFCFIDARPVIGSVACFDAELNG